MLLLCPFSFDFIVWHSGDNNNNNRFPMKLSKAINFLSGTVFQRISWRTFWHFLDSIFWAPSLLISFSLAFVGFRFQFDFLFSFAVPLPPSLFLSFPILLSMSCCVSLFDLYSNYFHNEINRQRFQAACTCPAMLSLPERPLGLLALLFCSFSLPLSLCDCLFCSLLCNYLASPWRTGSPEVI